MVFLSLIPKYYKQSTTGGIKPSWNHFSMKEFPSATRDIN